MSVTLKNTLLKNTIIRPIVYNTKLWLDASDSSTITLNGSDVSAWNDKSGNDYHATQGTETNQPLYNIGNFNGLNSILFDGVDNYLESNGVLLSDNDELTIFVVARRTSFLALFQGFFGAWQDGEANDFDNAESFTIDEGNTGIVIEIFRANAIGASLSHPGNGVPFVYTSKFDGTNNTGYLNGVASTPVAITGDFNIQNYMVGARHQNSTAEVFWNGDIGEIIVYDRALDNIERKDIEKYLSNKWI